MADHPPNGPPLEDVLILQRFSPELITTELFLVQLCMCGNANFYVQTEPYRNTQKYPLASSNRNIRQTEENEAE
jgi:hypothetical protein